MLHLNLMKETIIYLKAICRDQYKTITDWKIKAICSLIPIKVVLAACVPIWENFNEFQSMKGDINGGIITK